MLMYDIDTAGGEPMRLLPADLLMVVIRALFTHAEVKLLHAFYFVADILECTDGAVRRQAFENMGKSTRDVSGFLCQSLELAIVDRGIGHEDDGRADDIGVLLILGDVVHTDGLEAYAMAQRILADTDLLAVALRGHTNHVAFGVHMVLGELNVLKSAVDRLIVLIQHADAQQDNAGKIAVALQLAEILAAENDLILID